MNKIFTILCGIGMSCTTLSVQANTVDSNVYAQSYAIYMMYHPDTKQQSDKEIEKLLVSDFSDLFKQHKNPTETDFIAYEQARLEPVLKQRREMSLKQTYVRFGILDNNKDQKMTLKEFQASGMKTFDEMDKNQDGIISAADTALAGNNTGTHDGFKTRLPISMPMANTHAEFIEKYGKGKAYTTLGDYLSARDQQFIQTDTNKDNVVNEQEYVDEFMQRFDANLATGKEEMKTLFAQQFKLISTGKNTISSKDIVSFSKKLNQAISQ